MDQPAINIRTYGSINTYEICMHVSVQEMEVVLYYVDSELLHSKQF